ncbi:8-oxo-dGTP pyrophosphatase MutT, NUDIX family [Mycetocola miduiensis]|uniref:8-oxo-dGTP pyrophosphatase MutT, NUDIX family n=2 Tax=Mycetocola miduiensis TaxID=995034 RepID=A0A1I4ZK81_9MICO|nr:8-oxo-dGTP pyrophosphatase MutT, NUDIX family [Mycetocola miduiensis]
MAREGIPPTGETPGYRVAATVLLLRDTDEGPEVLLLQRPRGGGSFSGAWVFPGGAVDPEDRAFTTGELDEEASARRAALREVREETSLEVSPDALVSAACWLPPSIAPKPYRTWFYAARAPEGNIVLSPHEAVAHEWLRPAEALHRHAEGTFELVPPTWVMLHRIASDATVEATLVRAAADAEQFDTHANVSAAGLVFLWPGDIAYDDDALLETEGARHRLDARVTPWVYTRTTDG